MTKDELFDRLADVPGHFQLALSKYMLLQYDEDGEVEEAAVVLDDPIIGIAISTEHEEIRFVRSGSNLEAVPAEDKLTLLDGSAPPPGGA